MGRCRPAKKPKERGLCDFIGITGHKPRVLAKAIETGEFDTVLVPINVVTRQALEELLPVAKAHDVGVVAMKPLSAKTSNLNHLPLSAIAVAGFAMNLNSKRSSAETSDDHGDNALRYVLVTGCRNGYSGVAEHSAKWKLQPKQANNTADLTAEEQKRFSFNLGDYCRDCGVCMPCPQNVNIPAALRFHSFYETYGLKEWAKKLYSGLEVKADKCSGCGECEPKCPYNLSIQKKLQKSHQDMQKLP